LIRSTFANYGKWGFGPTSPHVHRRTQEGRRTGRRGRGLMLAAGFCVRQKLPDAPALPRLRLVPQGGTLGYGNDRAPAFSEAYNVRMTAQIRNLFGGVVLISAALLGGITLACSGGDSSESKQSTSPVPVSTPANGTPVDPKVVALTEARKTAREHYIENTQRMFTRGGSHTSIFEVNDELVIVSDSLKEKSDRDWFMRQSFDRPSRNGLCALGFKDVKLSSGVVFGDDGIYGLGCPETSDERAAKLQKRAEFANGLQSDFKSGDPDIQDTVVAQTNDELVFTAPWMKGMTPAMIRASWAKRGQPENACSLGFKGERYKTSSNDRGTFIPYNCPK
jgi:hypothetical protein